MRHSWLINDNSIEVEYKWKKHNWNSLKVKAENKELPILPGSEEEFITDHFWGYTKIDDSKTSVYGVEHPRWNVYQITDYYIQVDFSKVYGNMFSILSIQKPASVMLAEGSNIVVKSGSLF